MRWLYNLEQAENNCENSDKPNLTYTQQYCWHEWKETILIVSKVYDCPKCNLKKEDYDKWNKFK